MRRLSKVRLRYTGLVNFAAQLLTIATGFLFVMTVTRNLPAADFGIWQNIGDILSYTTILAGIVPFSIIRYMTRGHRDAAKTGIIANALLSLPIAGGFLVAATYIASTMGGNPVFFQASSVHILFLYILPALQSAVYGEMPQTIAYGTVVYELTKVVVGVVLVTYLGKGLFGAIAAVIGAQMTISLFYLAYVRESLRERINWSYLRSWWKISFISLYGTLGDRFANLSMILLIIIWGAVARAYVGAALTIASMICYSNALATALYPKLLAKPEPTAVESALKLMMLFAIPMTGGIIILSDSLLTILKPEYAAASTVLSVYAITCLLDCFSSTLNTVIVATERADTDRDVTVKELAKSRLFLVPTLTYVGAALNLTLLAVFLRGVTLGPLEAALYTSFAGILSAVPVFLIRYRVAKRSLPFTFPVDCLFHYLLATALMMLVLSQVNLAATLSKTLVLVLTGAIIYFGTVLAIDKEAREIAGTTIEFVRGKMGQPAK